MESPDIKRLLLSMLLIVVACHAAYAAGPNGVPQVAVADQPYFVPSLDENPAGLQKLYSNLGTKTDAYDNNLGWIVFGPDTGLLQWMAMPFTPKTDATVKMLKLAIGNEGGTVSVTVLFAQDASGIPGKTIKKWHVTNLFPWGECCTLDVAKDKTGIPVKKGQLYWIVAKTDATNANALDVWAYTWNHINGDIAYNVGDGWHPDPDQPLAAYAILGTKP